MENNRIKVRVNVKCSLSLIKHHAKKKCGAVKIYLHTFLIFVLDGSDWSVSSPGFVIVGPLGEEAGWNPEPKWKR
jgi:hypothetical protein